ncbi:GAF domain-containing protein [Pseudooceanicola sp. 216_PA32_1]|uniref:GAF domain-containing protein n=1 Tax=Pseudooceanicola pacificus TaxID=2676438 RepID=A0A844W6E7_9RHOB|nr:helix-turn-helix domain-containing protein [Pseudooceanicola pacificus]MWB78314.1 GAF domain-containing protein [Pseudooceanicola pacificus]
MTTEMISSLAQVFETLATGASHAEFDIALDRLRGIAAQVGRAEDFDRIDNAMNRIRAELRDRVAVEHGLNLLIETAHDLSGTLGTDALMRLIVSRTRALVGADLGWVTVQNPVSREFVSVHAEGQLSPNARVMRSHADFGIVGSIMQTRSYFHTTDYLNDKSFRHLPDLDDWMRQENVVSLTGFPILVGDQVLGFLFAAYRYSRKVSGRELSILGSFAIHAGTAMRNAEAFRVQSEALAEAEASRTALIDHIKRVEASAAAHDEMATLLATGADQSQYLQQMANQVDGAIFLYDRNLRVREEFVSVHYRGSFADRLRSDRALIDGLSPGGNRPLRVARAHLLAEAEDEQCRAIPLLGGTRHWEMLVICNNGRLDDIEVRNLERSAVALAIAKLWAEKREAEEVVATSTLIRHITHVSPPDPASVTILRDRLKVGLGDPVQMALLVFTGLGRSDLDQTVRDCATRHAVLVDELGGDTLVIGGPEALNAFLSALARRREGWQVGGIRSTAVADLARLADQYTRLREALAVLSAIRPITRVLRQEEVSLFARIFEARNAADLARHATGILAKIEGHGPTQGPLLKETLLRYFENQFNASRAADQLGIHVNTIRQRLQTLRELTGGWDDPVHALELQVALRLDAILTGLGE